VLPLRSMLGKARVSQVHIFDFGRSELNSPEKHAALHEAQKKDRADFWSNWRMAVDHLLWEAARMYMNRYVYADFHAIHVDLYDYDSTTACDYLGGVTLKLGEVIAGDTEQWQTLRLSLLKASGKPVIGKNGKEAQVVLEIQRKAYPEQSCFACALMVRVVSACNLAAKDWRVFANSSSDPFFLVTASRYAAQAIDLKAAEVLTEIRPLAGDGACQAPVGFTWATAQGPVLPLTTNPDWGRDDQQNPVLEFPEHSGEPEKALKLFNAFEAVLGMKLEPQMWYRVLPPRCHSDGHMQQCVLEFLELLDGKTRAL